MASPLCDTRTQRSDEGGRASGFMLWMYTTASCGGWSAKLLDNRQEKCLQKLLDNRLESALEKRWEKSPTKVP